MVGKLKRHKKSNMAEKLKRHKKSNMAEKLKRHKKSNDRSMAQQPPSMASDRDMVMVSSPTGTCYLANKVTGEIKWWAETNNQFIYIACKGDDVTDYVDLRPQDPHQIWWSDNDQYMYHFKNRVLKEIVPVDTKDEAQKSMDIFYQDSSTKVDVKTKRYYVDHTSGEDCKEGPSAFIIERSDFYLHRDSPSWSVRCSQLKASFPDYTNSGIRCPCTVLHARDALKFLQVCKKYRLMPPRDVSPLNDFVHNNNLYEINKKIKCPETDSLIVKGLYDKGDALIEKVRMGDANGTKLKEILRETCFHENVIAYLGWERDSEYDCYAFEVGGDTLENHIQRHPYKEMDESSLKIIKDFVRGVKHFHDRGLVHLNINPGNVLVKDSTTVKICGTSNCKSIADEPDGEFKDLQDVAHVILHIVSKGKYLRNNAVAGLVDENALVTLVGTTNFEVIDILKKVGIVQPAQSAQPIIYPITSLKELLLEPFFWKARKRLDFFEHLSDHFTGNNYTPTLKADVELIINDVVDSTASWHSKFTRLNAHLPNIRKYRAMAGRTYQDGQIRTLIKMIRDGRSHFEETKFESATNQKPQLRIDFTVKGEELGTNDTEMEEKFRAKFPKLLTKLRDAARGHSVAVLARYY